MNIKTRYGCCFPLLVTFLTDYQNSQCHLLPLFYSLLKKNYSSCIIFINQERLFCHEHQTRHQPVLFAGMPASSLISKRKSDLGMHLVGNPLHKILWSSKFFLLENNFFTDIHTIKDFHSAPLTYTYRFITQPLSWLTS